MKKIFTRYLLVYMLCALLIAVVCVFAYQTYVSNTENTANSYEKLAAVKEKLVSNDEEIEQLTTSLGDSALAKSRALARIIKENPALLEEAGGLAELCDALIVDEINVIDENGIITHSTIDAYVGFDMGSGEQSAAFLVLIDDPTQEIVQEPQENTLEHKLIQYIGVARQDTKGLVQVGVRPEVLENILAGTAIDVVLKDYTMGNTGYVFAIDQATGVLLAHENTDLIGVSAAEAGFGENLSAGVGKATVNQETGYYVIEAYNDMLLGTFLPEQEYYADRVSQTTMVSICLIVVFIALMLMINRMVSVKIVRGISHIAEQLQGIAGGNLDITVEENDNPEFKQLSESINKTVSHIKDNLRENEELMEQQKADVEANRQLVRNVKDVCKSITQVAENTLSNAQALLNGGEEQNTVIEQLHTVMQGLAEQLHDNEIVSQEVTEHTTESVSGIKQTEGKMQTLAGAITEIAEKSSQIEKIIGEIDSIATQTNMLSLNASIEAARAGEMGKGFAVVATQVGELASRSTEAAQETSNLIMASMQAVNKGQEIANQVMVEFMQAVEKIENSGKDVEQISDMARRQVQAVQEVKDKLDFIAEIINKNFTISKNSEDTAETLAAEAERLHQLTM